MSASPELVEVRLLRLPVEVQRRASEHIDGLQREFDLIRRRDTSRDDVPNRLLALIGELDAAFGGLNPQADEDLQRALDERQAEIDLVYRLPREAAAAAARLGELLDEADDYCRRGDVLLTLATPDESLRYRRWFLSQFIDQVAGADPVPWPEYLAATAPDDATGSASQPGGAHDEVRSVDQPGTWQVTGPSEAPTVALDGEIDLGPARALRDLLADLHEGGAETITLDCRSVSFIDSVGMSVLVVTQRRLDESGVDLRVLVPPSVHRALEIASLTEVLPVERVDV